MQFREKIYLGNQKLIPIVKKPFDRLNLSFINEFTNNILKNKNNFNAEQIKAAFFFRKKNLEKLKKEYSDLNNRLGLGVIFHVTPSNISINYIYSLFFSLISGNSNIIRISEKTYIETNNIIYLLKKILNKTKYKVILDSNKIINYSHNNHINEQISKDVEARVIWGGDDTVKNFRSIQANINSRDIFFPDRIFFLYRCYRI